ncbi:MAG: protein ImuA [Paracoccaceae bacterium]|jgi:protein ImuA
MTDALLSRRPHRPKSGLPFLGDLTLTPARAHEFCGPARRTLALILAQKMGQNGDSPVFWIQPAWHQDRLHSEGLVDLINPGRLTFLAPKRPEDLLWAMEEALRAACVPLVVCELPGIPTLTAVRRLHLAAETAAREHKRAPIGLLLVAGQGGIQGVESRWHMAPAHEGRNQRWHLERRRARMAPPKAWGVSRGKTGFEVEAPAVKDCI